MRWILLVLLTRTLWVTPGHAQHLDLPPRPAEAATASELRREWASLDRPAREARLREEVAAGNVPTFLRQLVPITDTLTLRGVTYTLRYYCTPDYLAVGSDTDYLRVPMSAPLAQQLANLTHANLPTPQMVDRIYQQAELRLRPQPIPPSPAMTTLPLFVRHDSLIRAQCDSLGTASRGQLVAGHKKDLVLSRRMYHDRRASVPAPVVIYGWHRLNGTPIQPVYNGHTATYADYSHGVRLVQDTVWVNGKTRSMRQLLRSRKWHGLLTREGRIKPATYPLSPRKGHNGR